MVLVRLSAYDQDDLALCVPLLDSPLGVLDGELYAGGQRDGALYRVVEER